MASILSAFVLQAWWEERQERGEEQEYLVALLDDVDAVVAEAERTIAVNDSVSEVSRRRIASLRSLQFVPDSLVLADQGISRLRANLDSYNDLISSGGVAKLRDREVRASLARLRAELDFEAETMEYAVVAGVSQRTLVMEASVTQPQELWRIVVMTEKEVTMWRGRHNERKRDVIRAAQGAREAILAATSGN